MNLNDRSQAEPDNNTPTVIKTHTEKLAETTSGSYITDVEKRVILKADDLSGKHGVALEIGCEGGRWSLLLANLGWDMICTDINPHTLAICQTRLPRAQCILVNARDRTLPCESESVGLLLCIEVNEVISSEWFISEASRVLQDGGLLVGTVTNRLSLRGYFRRLLRGVSDDSSYTVTYPIWRSKLRGQGFKMVYQEGICWFPFARASNSPFVPIFTRIEHCVGLRRLQNLSPIIVFLAQKA